MSADPLFDRLARALAGRYTLVRELGQGGMATVYLGTDLKLGRQVAIKALPPTTRAYLGSGRFQREVLLAAQLSRSEEHTSELQSLAYLVCRLLLEKKKK